MGKSTGIAWTTSSWSPWIGCTKVSPGCDHCYAEALDARHRYGGGEHWGPGVPRYRTKQWGEPLKWEKKAIASGDRWTVFPSLCDPFDNDVPEAWRDEFWELIGATPHLTWLLLTKRISNAAKMLPNLPVVRSMLENVWLGVSVVNQEEADRDLPKLLRVPAVKRFVSYEPALGPVDFERYFEQYPDHNGVLVVQNDVGIDWLIVGGESSQGGAKARPFDRAWARMAIAQCHAARVPCFVKQLGSNVVAENGPHGVDVLAPRYRDRAGADLDEWPADLKVQEFPA